MKHDKNKLYKDIKLILNEDFTDRELFISVRKRIVHGFIYI